jgi:NAD(P)-dependent dehydrogenase (short-subunit alcohol dehydrogenase family)
VSQPAQQQDVPGVQAKMTPRPDCGEDSYQDSSRLQGKAAVITGGDSGIGRAVAIAYAREGADVLISYLNEDQDAKDTARLVEQAGRRAVLMPGDVSKPQHCRDIIARAVSEFGKVDILVANAAYQMTRTSLEDIPDEEWDYTLATNVSAMFHLCKAAVPHMGPGSSIIGSSSVNSDTPRPPWLRTLPPRPPLPTSAPAWRSCSGSGASGSTVSRRARSGPRSSWPPCRRRRWRASARTRRSGAPDSLLSWRRSMSCSPPTRAATSPAPGSRSPAAGRSCNHGDPMFGKLARSGRVSL